MGGMVRFAGAGMANDRDKTIMTPCPRQHFAPLVPLAVGPDELEGVLQMLLAREACFEPVAVAGQFDRQWIDLRAGAPISSVLDDALWLRRRGRGRLRCFNRGELCSAPCLALGLALFSFGK